MQIENRLSVLISTIMPPKPSQNISAVPSLGTVFVFDLFILKSIVFSSGSISANSSTSFTAPAPAPAGEANDSNLYNVTLFSGIRLNHIL